MAWQLSPSLSCWLWGVRLIKINFHIDTSQTWTLFFSFLFLSYCPYILFIKRLSIVSITIYLLKRCEIAVNRPRLYRHSHCRGFGNISECESHWSIWWKEVRHWQTNMITCCCYWWVTLILNWVRKWHSLISAEALVGIWIPVSLHKITTQCENWVSISM